MERREFLQTAAALGTGACWTMAAQAAAEAEVAVALIGAGAQGRALANCGVLIPGLRFRAVCDLWDYNARYLRNYLKNYSQEAAGYADLRRLLDDEKGLQAAIIATPDACHADQVCACLEAGLHVYCEAPMAHDLAGAKKMLQTARRTKRLLQIGYHRRSHPRYRHARDVLLGKARLPGQLTQVNVQAVHPVAGLLGYPRKQTIPAELLKRHGYDDMRQLRNWMWFRRHGNGPWGSYASHQVDVVEWFLGGVPARVWAAGGTDFYPDREAHDNVMGVLEYPREGHTLRASFQVLSNTSAGGGGNFEHFLGSEGSLRMSDSAKTTKIFREPAAPDWDSWVSSGELIRGEKPPARPAASGDQVVRETGQVESFEFPMSLDTPIWHPHLLNFVQAIRGHQPLNCPAEAAWPTEVIVHRVLEAIAAARPLDVPATLLEI